MPKIIVDPDCGSSPKNLFLQKLSIAFAKGDTQFILSRVTDNIRWNQVGEKLIEGKDNFAATLQRMKEDPVAELAIQHVVTHGKAGAVNGTTKLKSGKIYAFCDVYEFSNAKGDRVREITSYVIEII